MDFQSVIQENIEVQDTELENNIGIVKVKMSNVNNRIDNAITTLNKQRHEWIHGEMSKKISTLEESASKDADEIQKLKKGNVLLDDIINEKKNVITSLKLSIKHWLRRYEQVQIDNIDLNEKCSRLQESQNKAERELEEAQKEIATLREEIKSLETKRDSKLIEHQNETPNIAQENFVSVICTLSNVIGTMSKELLEEKIEKERCMKDLEKKNIEVEKLTQKLEASMCDVQAIRENETLLKIGQAEMFTNVSQEKPSTKFYDIERDMRQNDVDNTSDYTQSSSSLKMISNLQKIIHYRTIATLQSDLKNTYSLIAELEKELEGSKKNHKLSAEVKRSPAGDW